MHLVDSGGYGVALLIIGVRGENTHLVARLLLGIDRFGYLTCILVDQAIGSVHDILGGTVIPFQLEDTATGIKILELQDIIYISAYEQNKELVESDMNAKVPLLREIYKRYQSRCLQAGAMDFDDLLLQTNILFRDFPDILAKYQQKFNYILVDEYQDTNPVQEKLVSLLKDLGANLCVVGDDDQTIYQFRGSDSTNILTFMQRYNIKKYSLRSKNGNKKFRKTYR